MTGFSSKLSNLSWKKSCQSIGQINDMCKFSEFSEAVYYSPGAWTLYKGIPKKYKGKLWKWVFWKNLCFKPPKYYLMTSGCNPEVQTVHLTPILPYQSMTFVRCNYIKYVIFDIYDVIDIYGTGHISWIDMAIWVS